MFVYTTQCTASMITLTCLYYTSFSSLLEKFEPLHRSDKTFTKSGNIENLGPKCGRPRFLNANSALGLILAWYRTRRSMMVLSLLFRVTSSACSIKIRFLRRILLQIWWCNQYAAVRIPNREEFFVLSGSNRASFIIDWCIRNNGWVEDYTWTVNRFDHTKYVLQGLDAYSLCLYIFNILLLGLNGTIIFCALNAPGALYNSVIAEYGRVYDKLRSFYHMHRGRVVADSAFRRARCSFIIKSAQHSYLCTENSRHLHKLKQATSLDQAAEWGTWLPDGFS